MGGYVGSMRMQQASWYLSLKFFVTSHSISELLKLPGNNSTLGAIQVSQSMAFLEQTCVEYYLCIRHITQRVPWTHTGKANMENVQLLLSRDSWFSISSSLFQQWFTLWGYIYLRNKERKERREEGTSLHYSVKRIYTQGRKRVQIRKEI